MHILTFGVLEISSYSRRCDCASVEQWFSIFLCTGTLLTPLRGSAEGFLGAHITSQLITMLLCECNSSSLPVLYSQFMRQTSQMFLSVRHLSIVLVCCWVTLLTSCSKVYPAAHKSQDPLCSPFHGIGITI